MRRATSSARARFLPNTAADSPYSVSLASSTASSTDFTRVIETCGPNDSSRNNCISGVTRSTTMPFMTVPSLSPPVSDAGALRDRIRHQSLHPLHRRPADQRSDDEIACVRIAGRQGGHPPRELSGELVGDGFVDDHALGRHADLAGVGERAEDGGVDGGIDIGIVEHHQRRLAAELEQDRLEVLRRDLREQLPTRVEPVKFTRRTAGCAISASAIASASFASCVTTLTTPSPRPASLRTVPISRCDAGQTSDAFRMTVLPHASGIATARTPRMIAAFHGAIPSTTPAG